ncbi:unnamed protein product, partial [Symbiodinium necroappetens]
MRRSGAWKPLICLLFNWSISSIVAWFKRRLPGRDLLRGTGGADACVQGFARPLEVSRRLVPWEVNLLRRHHGSMPPRQRDNPQKGKGKGSATTEESQKEALHFGYPPQLVTALQAIASRSTAGLFRDPVAIAADQSVQQLAQSQANTLDKLGKRLNGNLRAKLSLQEAATAWLGKIGQHLAALTSRLSTVAARLDQDQAEAITALQQASVHLEASAQEQVDKALGGMGPVWSQAQESEVLRIAASLRAFSAVGQYPLDGSGLPGPSVLETLSSSTGSATSTPTRPQPSGEGMDTSATDSTSKRRWNQRGNRYPRPSKSPRREMDLAAEPWTRVTTGLTPERPDRWVGPSEEEELIPAVPSPPFTWTTAWCQISRQCWEQGGDYVGLLGSSEAQEQARPLQGLTADPAPVIAEGEAAWAARRGLLILAHAVMGHLYSIDDFGPSTAQVISVVHGILWLSGCWRRCRVPYIGSQTLSCGTFMNHCYGLFCLWLCTCVHCQFHLVCSAACTAFPVTVQGLGPSGATDADGVVAEPAVLLQARLPAEQLLFAPPDLGWNAVLLPIDVRGERSDTCGQLLANALELQGRFRALHGVLGRCCLGWFSLGSQPLILPSVDALQFAYGPEPGQVQPLFGTSLEPPFTLDTLMQVSAVQAGPPLELFSGFSANHAVLITPNGLVYVEVPVFADSNTYRRLVTLQASPSAAGGIMRLWQPLPSLPHVQLLEVHCTGTTVPCVLDFRPTGWRIVTTCVEPPVTPVRALESAVDDGLDLPSECGGFGILHKETAVAATQPLLGGAPFVLMFFPHIFTHDDDSSGQAIGGQVGSIGHLAASSVEDPGPSDEGHAWTASPYDVLVDASFEGRLQTHWQHSSLDVAGLSGRPRVFAASLGLSITQVHLVMASTASATATVLFDAGFEVWCADVPRHAPAPHLLTVACDLATTDALQLNTEISLLLRHGDVLPVRLDADQVQVDLSRHVLARPAESAAVWLDPVQSFYLLSFSRGVQGFQVAVGSDVQVSMLRALLPPDEGPGGTFLELPSRASLPLRLFVHCRQGNDHVVFRVSEASDPSDTGFFFLFSGAFDTYADFARRLGQLQTAEARWLRALRPYGLRVTAWESMELTRSAGASFWYVQLHADILRAQLHFAHVRAVPASFTQVELHPAPGRPVPQTTKATQTIAGPGGFPHEMAVWQTPPQPTHCEPGLFPEVSSTLADVWCDAWHIKYLIPCIPGYKAWVLRDGNRLIGLCTVDITWDLVSQALHISTWELPQTFVHGDGLLVPYPEPLHHASDKCLSVSHDTPEAVNCLHQITQNRRQSLQTARSSAAMLPPGFLGVFAGFCLSIWRLCLGFSVLLLSPGVSGVRLDDIIADAAADPAPDPLPFRDYMDLTRTCTMSWTHELSRQALGFSVRAQILGEHLQRIAPAPEVLLNLWRPGRGPTLLQVRPRRLALHLASFLRALGYAEGIDSLHIAFDTSPHVLDLVLVPPTGGTWWILQDSTGREILRGPAGEEAISPAQGTLPEVAPEVPTRREVACQTAHGEEASSDPTRPNASPAQRRYPPPHSAHILGILGMSLLGARAETRFLAGLLGVAASLDGVFGSYFTPDASGSEDDDAHPADVPEGHRPGDGLHLRPAGPPPPTPAGAADDPDPADARLVYNETMPPDLNFLPGSMRSVHVTRRFPAPTVIRWVQNRARRSVFTTPSQPEGNAMRCARKVRPPAIHIDVVQDTVTFRSGDCFRIDTEREHTAASEYARLEEADHETAEVSSHPTPGDISCGGRPLPALLGLLGGIVFTSRRFLPWWWAAGIAVSLAMHRPGGFPWQTPSHERVFRLPDTEAQVQVLYYSPFLGNFPAYWAAPDTDQSTVWAQFLNDDAAWATDFFPVWPGLHFNALAFIPVGGDISTVTVIFHYRGFGRAVLMPRTVTDSWLQSFASQQVSADVEDIFLPHALEAWRFYDVPPPDYRLRNGDVIYLRDRERGRDPLEAEEPWDIQTSGTGQHAPWAVGFRLDSDTVADLLQPGHRPTFVSIPAGETWAPVQCTFSGDFHLQHPGMWTPVQWSSSSVPQLMLISGVAAEANVVVASPAGRRVRAIPRHASRVSLATCTGLCRDSLVLGGVPLASLDAGVEIRNGDVVFGDPATCSSASMRRLPLLLLATALWTQACTRHLLLGVLLLVGADAMQQPLAFSFNAYRVGRTRPGAPPLEHFALCIPRVATVAWLVSALRTARVLDVLSLRIPPALGQSSGDSQDEITWRTGDLIVVLPPDAFTGLFQTPVFTRAEQLRHCAIWSLDFCLAAKSD